MHDGGMMSVGRTAEAGLTTLFTPGDRIGVFAVRDGAIFRQIDNLCLTATASGDSIIWITDDAAALTYTAGVNYYAYYPYNDILPERLLLADTGESADCFSYIIAAWRPLADQSDYAGYTASDLMTACGTMDGRNLTFDMHHMMARVEISFPARATEIVLDHGLSPLHSDDAYVLLINPDDPDLRLSGHYTDSYGLHRWSIPSVQRRGTVNYYTVDPDR